MAKLVLRNPHISIGGNDVSDDFMSVAIDAGATAPESTTFGDEWSEFLAGGLKNWTMNGDRYQDFAAGEIDSILWPLLGTSVAIVFRPTSGALSTSNPQFTGNAILTGLPIIGGSVGDAVVGNITLQGSGALARATS